MSDGFLVPPARRPALERTWSLEDVAPRFVESEIRAVRRMASEFSSRRKSLKPSMGERAFLSAISEKEKLHERMARLSGYASLGHAADTQSDRATSLAARIDALQAEVSNASVFFGLWWQKLDGADARRLGRRAGRVGRYLERKRLLARHSLSEPEERVVGTLEVTGASALVRIYDKITGAFEYRLPGRRPMNREQLSALVKSPRAGERRAAYRALLSRYGQHLGVLGEIYQNVARNWGDECVRMRGYASPISARNAANDLDDRTVGALLGSCREGAAVFRRFFARKARLCGMEKMGRADLYAPVGRAEKRTSWAGAVKEVLAAFDKIGAGGMVREVLGRQHVDSQVRRGKRDGAFCASVTPKTVPYVMLSYTGAYRDAFTLAHEMGHAVHAMAARGQSILVHDAPLPLAETASTFSELLLYEGISGRMSDSERRSALAGSLDDLYASIVRQAFFTVFEEAAHKLASGGGTVAEASEAYLATLKEQFGRAVSVPREFSREWAAIPHFYHAPFYCYSYSFGNLLALALFARYRKEGRDFAPAYMEILGAGGSQKPEDLLSAHGFSVGTRGFWRAGLGEVSKMVSDLD